MVTPLLQTLSGIAGSVELALPGSSDFYFTAASLPASSRVDLSTTFIVHFLSAGVVLQIVFKVVFGLLILLHKSAEQ